MLIYKALVKHMKEQPYNAIIEMNKAAPAEQKWNDSRDESLS